VFALGTLATFFVRRCLPACPHRALPPSDSPADPLFPADLAGRRPVRLCSFDRLPTQGIDAIRPLTVCFLTDRGATSTGIPSAGGRLPFRPRKTFERHVCLQLIPRRGRAGGRVVHDCHDPRIPCPSHARADRTDAPHERSLTRAVVLARGIVHDGQLGAMRETREGRSGGESKEFWATESGK
jgi:hypothetical protein